MPEIEPSNQLAWTGSGHSGNEAVVGAASEALSTWLHRRYPVDELPSGALAN